MKYLKISVLIAVFLFLSVFPAFAAETDVTDRIDSLLPGDAQELMESSGLSDLTQNGLDTKGFFSLIASFFKEGIASPLSAMTKALSVLILSALMSAYCPGGKTGETVNGVCLVSTAIILAYPVYEVIAAAKEIITAVSVFMSGALPVFAAVKAASGKPVSVSGSAAVMLFACQALSYLCAYLFTPFMNSYLALGICSSFGGERAASGIMSTVKKVAMWTLSLCVSVFLFILSVKAVAGKGSDTLALKTAKFVLGTTVPVVGTALSESAGAVSASLSALSGTAGIYVILGVFAIMLPLLTRLLCWRLSLMLIKYLSTLFSAPAITSLSVSVESVVALLLGFCLLVFALFIISLGVIISL